MTPPRKTVAQKQREAAAKTKPKIVGRKKSAGYTRMLKALKQAKDLADEVAGINATLKPVKQEALKLMLQEVEPDANGKRSIEEVVDGVRVKAAIVEASGGLEFDEEGIRKKYGEEVWQQITTRVFDPAAFHQAIEAGIIPKTDIPKFVTDTKKDPYVRIS